MKGINIAVLGYYGANNIGDDMALISLIDILRKINKIKGIYVLIPNRYLDSYEGDLEKYGCNIVKWYEMNKIQKIKFILFENIHLYLWGGGTIFTNEEGDGNYKMFKIIKFLRKKYAFISVGIGKLSLEGRLKKSKWVIDNSSFSIFRDLNSLSKAKKMSSNNGLFYSPDIVYNYLKECHEKLTSNKRYISITWRNLEKYIDTKLEIRIMNYICEVINSYFLKNNIVCDILILTFDKNIDMVDGDKLKKYLGSRGIGSKVYSPKNIKEGIEIINDSFFHISSRLHTSFISEFLSVDTLTFSYSPKIDYLYEQIKKKELFINIHDAKKIELTLEKYEKCVNKNADFLALDNDYKKILSLLDLIV